MRRLLLRILAAAVCVGLLLPMPASAANIFFTAVNNTVTALTADTMPVYSGGVIYVPYTVFDGSSTGISLGVYTSYSRSNNTVTLFNLRQMLVFDLSAGTCRDDMTGEYLPARAIVRNNRPYVPVEMVCAFFDLTYSLNRISYVSDGYLVRITSGGAMDDGDFIAGAEDIINRFLREYNQSTAPAPDPGGGTSTPDPNPDSGEDGDSPSAVRTYLAFRCESGEGLSDILDALDSRGDYGLFLLSPQVLEQEDDLLRRILGSGHSAGVLAEGAQPQDTLALLEEGSRILEQRLHLRPTIACVPEAHRAAAEGAGWVCWDETLHLSPSDTVGAATFASNTLLRLSGRTRPAYLTLEGGTATARVLPTLLRQLEREGFVVSIPMETRL